MFFKLIFRMSRNSLLSIRPIHKVRILPYSYNTTTDIEFHGFINITKVGFVINLARLLFFFFFLILFSG